MTGAQPPQVAVERDLDRSITVITITGRITLASARRVRAELLRCLREYPLALVVDLSRLTAGGRTVFRLFPAAVRRGRRGPTVALALCAAQASGPAARCGACWDRSPPCTPIATAPWPPSSTGRPG